MSDVLTTCVHIDQGRTHFQEVGRPPDPRPELHRPPPAVLPLVAALAGGEGLFPHVHEPRQRPDQLCAAVWPRVQREGGPRLHGHQVRSVHRELHPVGPLCFFLLLPVGCVFMPLGLHNDPWVFFLCRNLIIKCSSYRQAHWWSHEINHLADTCDFLKVQRFEGFAPPRENTLTKWFDLKKTRKKHLTVTVLFCISLTFTSPCFCFWKVCEWKRLLCGPGWCSGTSQGGNLHHRLVVSGIFQLLHWIFIFTEWSPQRG